MAKRDIKVNYDALGDTLGSIGTYRKALDELRASVDKVNNIITASNDAETIDKLERRYKKAKKRLDECYGELDALYTLIDGYIDDMTAIIRPKKGLTRVGRNDIYWNLESIRDAVDCITDVQFSHNIWYSTGIGKTEEEKQAMERNYNKLQTEVWGNIFAVLKQEVSASLKKLQGYYDHEVVDYENRDDSYKLKAMKVRYQYSSAWELFQQNGIDYVESNWKLVKGAGMAVVDLLKGLYSIGNMIYYYHSGKAAAIVMLISPEPPKWTEETLGESEDYFGNMTKAITHPLETLEAMAQNLNDTYEVEGLEYMGGYVIGDIVVGELSAAAVSKAVGKGAGAVDDIGNIANKADDVADIAETAGKMDDVVDAARTAEKTGDVAELAGKGKLKVPDYVKLSEELRTQLEKEGYKIIDIEDAVQANADWYAKGYTEPPIAKNTKVYNVEAGNHHYVRTYNTEWDNYNGKWIMRVEDIEELSAAEIAEKYAMPSPPDMICDVDLPPDTPLEISIVGEQPDWANSLGGNTQYGIKDVETSEDWFVNKRSLN